MDIQIVMVKSCVILVRTATYVKHLNLSQQLPREMLCEIPQTDTINTNKTFKLCEVRSYYQVSSVKSY